jgi:hypothetical protein
MQKSSITFGDDTITFAELNTAQVKDLLDFSKQENPDYEQRKWETIARAVNNADKIPTTEAPLGSLDGLDALKARIGFASSNALHSAILDLSGLKPAKPGEMTAAEGSK